MGLRRKFQTEETACAKALRRKNRKRTNFGWSALNKKENSTLRGPSSKQGPDGAGLACHIFALLLTHVHGQTDGEGEYAHVVI